MTAHVHELEWNMSIKGVSMTNDRLGDLERARVVEFPFRLIDSDTIL